MLKVTGVGNGNLRLFTAAWITMSSYQIILLHDNHMNDQSTRIYDKGLLSDINGKQ